MTRRIPLCTLLVFTALLSAAALRADAPQAAEEETTDREAFLTHARKLIRDNNYDSASTPHYKIRTDDPRLDVVETANLLEEFRTFFEQFWSKRLPLRPDDEKAEFFFFYSRYKYGKLYDDRGGDSGLGHFAPYFNIVAIHTDTAGLGDLPDVIVHEAAHQLSLRRLFPRDRPPSAWVIEGIAEYFGNMKRDRKKGFQPDRIGDKGTSVFHVRVPKGTGVRRPFLREYRRLLKQDELLPLEFFVELTSYADFQLTNQTARYMTAWLLVRFLLDADGGAHAPGFSSYLELEMVGEAGPEAFYGEIGVEPEALQAAYNDYVLKLKAR